MQQDNENISAQEIGWIVRGEEHHTGTQLGVRAPFDQSVISQVWQATWMDARSLRHGGDDGTTPVGDGSQARSARLKTVACQTLCRHKARM